jgi:hypothetical protein
MRPAVRKLKRLEDSLLLGCDAIYSGRYLLFIWRKLLLPPDGRRVAVPKLKSKPR